MIKENLNKTDSYSLQHALDPAASVFVSANAGAGKTSLLTNRALRLLLHGTAPSKILCLTFTNAAAAEMANRIQSELGTWVMADEAILQTSLTRLLGQPADNFMMARARRLFAQVLESPEGIRIQTIHGFCQSLLRRFPIEAGINPHFTVMDARSEQELLQEARLRLFNHAQNQAPRLQEALRNIAHTLGESAFTSLVSEIIQNKRRIHTLLTHSTSLEAAVDTLYRLLKISPDITHNDLIASHFVYDVRDLTCWERISKSFLQGEEGDQARALTLIEWFSNISARKEILEEYLAIFLTQKGTPRVKLFKKGQVEDPLLIETLIAEQKRAGNFSEAVKTMTIAQSSEHLLHFADALLALYTQLKNAQALMDYDDLIMSACDLLGKPGISPWVLFKLDGGIDHIMVDEAQDTSPEQWIIIDALTQDFFAGKGRSEQERSLFIVGDEKQSIYSFQGADPVALGRMQQYFATRIEASEKLLHRVELHLSFRSTPEVLSVVDAVFARTEAREGLTFGSDTLTHIPTRLAYSGLVELWPLVEPVEEEGGINISALTLLARQIAFMIKGWIDDGMMLAPKNRVVHAGDIMILVRSRTSLVERLVRALKKQGVAVAGHDRMALSDNLAVQDLIALGQCLLLPDDDLIMAALLKSPIFNITEDQLFTLAWNRGKASIWERLKEEASNDPIIKNAYEMLTDIRARTDFISPFALYTYVLDTLGARRRFTGRMGDEYSDPIDEFLGQALLYERSHTTSMQGFLNWLGASDSEIKRDMEQTKNAVRIMTVHGAKGLQAPIVILPDTTELPRMKNTIHWHEERNIPLWVSSSHDDAAISARIRANKRDGMLAEYRRLLYVALTRAEDRLYIFGATAKEAVNDNCWYNLIKEGIAPIASSFEVKDKHGFRVGEPPARGGKISVAEHATHPISDSDFAFLHEPVTPEPVLQQPLVPSRLVGEEPATASPLESTQVFQRGKLIHRLLQYLPTAALDDREDLAHTIASRFQRIMTKTDIDSCIAEARHIIESPEFAFLFETEALVEVPVAGCVTINGKTVTVAGQIDRLCTREHDVWIIDFKSNRVLPETIPASYLQQMRLYYLLLQQIYPHKSIHCVLVWTAIPYISVIDQSLLDETPISTYI